MPCASPQPRRINPPVCPLPRSLATTSGISVDFSSSPYLDVSVQAVPHIAACHVLLRLSMPRHSPCALSSLTSSEQAAHPSLPPCGQSSLAPLLLLSSPNPLALGFGSGTGDASLLRGCSTGSLRIMQASDSVHCSLCYPFKKFHN